MCTNGRYVLNKYTNERVFVSCGHCPACLQERAAHRTSRIRNHAKEGYVYLFVTLTYSPEYLPFVYLEDLYNLRSLVDLPVFRSAKVRYYRDSIRVVKGTHVIGVVPVSEDMSSFSLIGLKSPLNSLESGTVGVLFYKDIKTFWKKLRINLKRYYGYTKYISGFNVGEYGPTTLRPHFHLLIQCPTADVETLQSAIVKSWSYADLSRTSQYIEIAKDAASYVSSYVNCVTTLPEILKARPFRPKHSHSKDFGYGLQSFSLDSLLSMQQCCDFSYPVTKIEQGFRTVVNIPVPKYVISRFFPKFRGYFLLSPLEVRELLPVPRRLASVINRRGKDIDLIWSDDDVRAFSIRICNLYDIYWSSVFPSFYTFLEVYPILFVDVWSAYSAYLFRYSYEHILPVTGFEDYFENPADLVFGNVHSDLSPYLDYQLDPNARVDVVDVSSKFKTLFYQKDKSRKITNLCLSNQDINV